jgi:aminoglycoside phosphotransferase family enzyme/predicted kinase
LSEVVAFLETGGLGEPVERVDTHGAHVFLGRERVWKMKRPVKFRFMDFSTLDQREQTIRRELELNRRTAPSIYRQVVPVVRRADGALEVGGSGTPVEWLLEMARFERDDQLDRMAETGRLSAQTVEELARRIAGFHEAAQIVTDGGGHDGLAEVVAGNTADLMDLAPSMLDKDSVEELDRQSREHLTRHRGLLDRRREAGWVRLCHGDLHLGNVVMLDGVPTPFDCLEFDPALASVDVIYDLAFLIMDLLQRGLPAHAQRALQGWIEATEDDEAVALLPLCVATRAAVRAKVEGLQQNGDAARRYLRLALAAFTERPPILLALGGVSGTGKTTLARGIAPELGRLPGAVLLRSDVIRKRLFNKAPEERLGPEAYAAEISARVFGRIAERAERLLGQGQAVIADAVYGEAWQRAEIARAAERAGAAFKGCWLEAPPAILEERVAGRSGDASDATVEVLRRQLDTIDRAAIAWTPVDASGEAAATLEKLRRAIRTGG